jgi:hypothetical protein
MLHETRLGKTMHGVWKAESSVMLDDTLCFTLTTMKRASGSVVTSASVAKREGNFYTHRMYEDYSRQLDSHKYPRVTAKVVENQHIFALSGIDDYINEARAKYGIELIYA